MLGMLGMLGMHDKLWTIELRNLKTAEFLSNVDIM
jgi:hypothetical protein